MRGLGKRLSALEAAAPNDGDWAPILDGMSDADLERLEGIVLCKEAGTAIEDLSDKDLRFLASIRIGKTEPA